MTALSPPMAVAPGTTGPPARHLPPFDSSGVRVAVVIPVRNEAPGIVACLDAVAAQTFPAGRLQVIVVDGRSSDQTRELVTGWSRRCPGLKLLDNPATTIPAAMNIGIAAASDSDVVVRVDGHCRLAPDYVAECVRLLAATGAANAGGLMRPEAAGPVGQAMAAALCSPFGVGDSRFHDLSLARPEWAETVYLGAFRTQALAEVGGYDEAQLVNEDFELNHRLRQAGYGIVLSPDVRSTYRPRESLSGISRQFFGYGRWKARVMVRHPRSIRPRHLVPPALVLALIGGAAGSLLLRRRWPLLPALVYALTTGLAVAATDSHGRPSRFRAALIAVFPTIHVSWGAGVLAGLLSALKLRTPRP